MTVATAAPRRAVIDLGAEATILDAARQLAATDSPDVVLVVTPGAPLIQNALYLDVLQRRAGERRVVLVTADARARSLAASVHMRSFSTIAALDRHELDATEHLSDARRAALTRIATTGGRRGSSIVRGLAAMTSLVAAGAILLAVIAPSATIVLSATTTPLGPYEYDLRAGPGGDINAITLIDRNVSAKISGTATGNRDAQVKATGFERFTNLTTNDIRIPMGTIVQTQDSPPIRFQTTEEKLLPRSTILPPTISSVTVGIVAVEVGPRGNVPADRITQDSSPDYVVTNPAPTTGGEDRKIPVVSLADYELTVARSDGDPKVKAAAEARVRQWRETAQPNTTVHGYLWSRTGASPPSEVVGREGSETFEITITGTVTAYTVASAQPKRAATEKLRDQLSTGMDMDDSSANVDIVIGPAVAEDGVHWRVRASATQYAGANQSQMKAALAGRGFDEVAPFADRAGFRVEKITPWPSWWPRLPVLDSRITIQFAPAAASPP